MPILDSVKLDEGKGWSMSKSQGALSGIRVLEFAGEIGSYTGKLFANLGAEVIQIESIEGSPIRRAGPFYKDIPDQEGSLQFIYQNTNKKGIVLDIEKEQGREIFLNLVKTADLLLESFPPGYLNKLNLGYEQLSAINPKLVYTSVTGYGQNGPYRDYPWSDITSLAMGGLLYLAAQGDDIPARVPDSQTFMMGAMYAATGSMVALLEADDSGSGQYLDVSLQECVATALENAIQFYDLEGSIRRGIGHVEAGMGIYPCQDGYVYLVAGMGGNVNLWNAFVDWLIEEKVEGAESLAQDQWKTPQFRRTAEAKQRFNEIVVPFAMKHNKLYLFENGQDRRVTIHPVNNPKDICEDPHIKYRKFMVDYFSESLGGQVFMPGAPYRLSQTPWKLGTEPPKLGQHTAEILQEIGYNPQQIQEFKQGGVCFVAQASS
ncbi:CaiB/BaiF CoA-transferase family protein [Desulfosporosinus sp. BICA1-9]|uniref:CaiB/BaiF CoA transferase family protein n=1 Tax=Desulfosporosinus sp. BICA1-9 TaxID=1531958 RepID=UPI000AD81F30|nr:CaiB/BaiF CoA-transferase family protein [Desulfosporosinus sp. BICA1-9]